MSFFKISNSLQIRKETSVRLVDVANKIKDLYEWEETILPSLNQLVTEIDLVINIQKEPKFKNKTKNEIYRCLLSYIRLLMQNIKKTKNAIPLSSMILEYVEDLCEYYAELIYENFNKLDKAYPELERMLKSFETHNNFRYQANNLTEKDILNFSKSDDFIRFEGSLDDFISTVDMPKYLGRKKINLLKPDTLPVEILYTKKVTINEKEFVNLINISKLEETYNYLQMNELELFIDDGVIVIKNIEEETTVFIDSVSIYTDYMLESIPVTNSYKEIEILNKLKELLQDLRFSENQILTIKSIINQI